MFSTAETVSQNLPCASVGRLLYHTIAHPEPTPIANRVQRAFVEILEQPVSVGARFRYKCEGRSAGCIRGINSTDKQKTYPAIKIHGYQGAAGVVVSCVTKDGPPHQPHPHNLVGKTCTNGVCYKSINTPDMICTFTNLGIQCVKKKDIKESLKQREEIQVDPFGTGFNHNLEPNTINLNALRLCFQVFLPDENGKLSIPLPPVISNAIFDNKTVSDLTITKLSHCSAPVSGGQEIILLCDQVNKDDIQILFFEETDNKVTWYAHGKFAPHHVHRKAAISFQTPLYKNSNCAHPVICSVQLRRPSDGALGRPVPFTFHPLKHDPDGLYRKRSKFETLRLDCILQPNNLPTEVPRPIKQAVRSKMKYQSNIEVPKKEHQIQLSSALLENIPSLSRQKVEEILAVAKQQVGLVATQAMCESTCEEALDSKLSSLDLGIDPSELDANLSGINLDSFSDPSGLTFSNLDTRS